MVEYKTRGTPQSKNNMKNKKNFKKKTNTKIVENEAQQIVPSTKTKVHLMTQELKFVKTLAGNDALLRDKILKNLKKWLISRSKSSFRKFLFLFFLLFDWFLNLVIFLSGRTS